MTSRHIAMQSGRSGDSASKLREFTPASLFHLQKQVNKLERELRSLKESTHVIRSISLPEAEKEILQFIRQVKKSGRKSVSDFEVAETLDLPLEQVDAVLDKHYEGS